MNGKLRSETSIILDDLSLPQLIQTLSIPGHHFGGAIFACVWLVEMSSDVFDVVDGTPSDCFAEVVCTLTRARSDHAASCFGKPRWARKRE